MGQQYAFVFPGQGSQQVGMLSELASQFPIIQQVFGQASLELGLDLWSLCQLNEGDKLNQTEFTQPALLTAGVAMWQLWQQQQTSLPKLLAGHSLGEYTALVCAEALDFQDAVKLVSLRGKFMQEAVPRGAGAMAAIIGLSELQVEEICHEAKAQGGDVMPANYNTIGQVVIAGNTDAVDKALILAKEKGAKLARPLPVSVPSHCDLMKPAALKLAEHLKLIKIKSPRIPVIQNVDVCCYQDGEQIRDALIRQLYSPVRWVDTIQQMVKSGIQIIIESGPGKVLTGLNKKISDELTLIALSNTESVNEALSYMGETV